MKHKTSKIKRIAVTALAAVCAMSSLAAISASAASESYTYTVGLAYGDATEHGIPTTKAGIHSNTFGSNPTIYDGKTTSTVQTYVIYNNFKNQTAKYNTTLQSGNPSRPYVNYKVTIPAGEAWHQFYVTGGGGFSDSVTSRNTY